MKAKGIKITPPTQMLKVFSLPTGRNSLNAIKKSRDIPRDLLLAQ